MAAFDLNDVIVRVRRWLPQGWFPSSSSDENGIVYRYYAQVVGVATVLQTAWRGILYTALQSRIATATDGFLDLSAYDFFGLSLQRKSSEGDDAYRARIQAALLPDGATRPALIAKLTALTGHAPRVFEPRNPIDTGTYGTNSLAYGVAGGYGSMILPYQGFVTAYRPSGGGIANISGYYAGSGPSGGGYGAGLTAYVTPNMVSGQITDADIEQAIGSVIPEGTIAWMNITNAP